MKRLYYLTGRITNISLALIVIVVGISMFINREKIANNPRSKFKSPASVRNVACLEILLGVIFIIFVLLRDVIIG